MEEEHNLVLMEEFIEGELKVVLQSFQKDKRLGPCKWMIEFFLELFELFGGDILRIVEDNRLFGRIPASFNSNCIDLIPKLDNPISLNDFKPISLYNCIYKVVSKVIA